MSNSGGTERVAANLLGMFIEDHIDTEMVILNNCKESFYEIDSNVKVVNLALERTNKKQNKVLSAIYSFAAICEIRRYMKNSKPDIVLAIWTDPAVYASIAKIGLNTKVVACEHTAYEARQGLWRILRKFFYSFSDAIVALTQRDTDIYKKMNKMSYRIVNAVDTPNIVEFNKEKTILAVGSIVWHKGFDLLIGSWKIVCDQFPDWHLKIIGAGRESEYGCWLQSEIRRLNLSDRVTLLPPKKNIAEEYSLASIFALSSRQEGLPMVLLEAMASGLPAVAFDCPTGPRDVIIHNRNGILVQNADINGMAESLALMIKDKELRERYAACAQQDIKQRFGKQTVMNEWQKLFSRLL